MKKSQYRAPSLSNNLNAVCWPKVRSSTGL